MDSRLQGILISTVGFIYASTGFAMSLIGTLLEIFIYTEPNPDLLKSAVVLSRGRRKAGSPSHTLETTTTDEGAKSASSTVTRAKPPKRSRMGQHRRSRSLIPIITIHHPEATSTFSATFAITSVEATTAPAILHSEPLQILEPAEQATPPRPSTSVPQHAETSRQKFRFSTLKATWTEKKPKLTRCISSPDLSPASPMPPMPLPRKSTSNDQISIPKTPMKWRSKSLQRPTTAPSSNKIPSVKLEKKRSQPLRRARTQPYEAPYFCPPPVPVPRRRSGEVSEN